MTRQKKIIFTAIGYFLNILLFALVYWIFWVNNPSNFIVNEQYNEQTIKPFFFHGDLPDPNMVSGKMMTAREANEIIKPYYDTLSLLNQTQHHIDGLLLKSKILDSLNHDKLMTSFDNNFKAYLSKQVGPYYKTKDSIEFVINDLKVKQKNNSTNSSKYFQYDVEIANLYVHLAQNDVVLNQTKYNVYDKSLKSMPSFYDDTLYQIANILYNKIDSLENQNEKLLEAIGEEKEKIRLVAVNYYMNTMYKLGFYDFIYFSIITASSTGYGDILPNNSTIRNLVSVEIILSLFLFGFFFYFISQPRTDRKNKPNA